MTASEPFDLTRMGAGLPVAGVLDQVAAALAPECTPRAVVLTAEPGTGKTTLIPPLVATLLTGSKVLVCIPRRVAARAAATRLCQLSGTRLGQAVGLRMRGQSTPGARVEFVTPGVLLRMVLSNPDLPGVGAVVFDEVHERHLEADLAVALVAEVAAVREDLAVVAMSATLASQQWAAVLGGAPVVTCAPGAAYPVEWSYHPHPDRLGHTRAQRLAFARHLAGLAAGDVAAHGQGVVVFVPGVREVADTAAAARQLTEVPVVELHGRQSAAQQAAVLDGDGGARIVVATAIAETSLTVPGVRAVVDGALAREPRRDAARGFGGLVTVSAAASQVEQRAGRAHRLGPGRAYVALSPQQRAQLRAWPTPEIHTADLTDFALVTAAWGTPRGAGLPLIDAPDGPALDAAEATLHALGALTDRGTVTAHGQALARLPLDPRLGSALLTLGAGAAETLALIAEGASGDLAAPAAAQAVPARQVARLRRLASAESAPVPAGVVVGTAFPQAIARATGNPGEYLLASGTRASLPPGSALSGAPWLAIAQATRSTNRAGATIRAAARIEQDRAVELIGVTDDAEVELVDGRLRARRVRRAGAIVLSTTPGTVTPAEAGPALARLIAERGTGMFAFSPAARELADRLRFLHRQCGDPWPDPDAADPAAWLGPELDKVARGATIGNVDMLPALRRLIPWHAGASIDEAAPQRLAVPSGNHPRIDYSSGRPVVRVKLQECFGLEESPRIAGVPVQFHLLSPAGRELAITDDLDSFFDAPYQQIRAEMRGRYPKHPWPQDPRTAQATARTTRAQARHGARRG